jgi:hypothetical protein
VVHAGYAPKQLQQQWLPLLRSAVEAGDAQEIEDVTATCWRLKLASYEDRFGETE